MSTVERQNLSTLLGERIGSITTDERNYLVVKSTRGKILFKVRHEDLFDSDGNHFDDEYEYQTE